MNSLKHKLFKVFDCTDMPDDLRHGFFALWDNLHNDSVVDWNIHDTINPDDVTEKVDQWLLANGAEDFEYVLIRYRW